MLMRKTKLLVIMKCLKLQRMWRLIKKMKRNYKILLTKFMRQKKLMRRKMVIKKMQRKWTLVTSQICLKRKREKWKENTILIRKRKKE